MRHRIARYLPVLLLAPLCLVLYGCPKKTPPPEPSGAAVTTTTRPSVPTAPQPTRPGTSAEIEQAQIAALKGEDIPLAEVPRKGFLEPTPAEREIFQTVYFDFDKSDIKPVFRPVLEGIGEWMRGNPGRLVLIEGHCDERGTNEYNLALGERRALSIRRYLVGLGINPERLHTISYGEEKPAKFGHDEAAWALNRRADFKISAPE